MDTQLDNIFLRDLLMPLTKRLLKGLKDKINEQKRENWLEIYLTIFIMMSNMGWVMKDILAWAGRYGKKVKSLIFPFFYPNSSLPHNCSLLHADFTIPSPEQGEAPSLKASSTPVKPC
jgi:hypothetical protein